MKQYRPSLTEKQLRELIIALEDALRFARPYNSKVLALFSQKLKLQLMKDDLFNSTLESDDGTDNTFTAEQINKLLE